MPVIRFDAGPAVEVSIKRQNAFHAFPFHDRQMQCVAGRESGSSEQQVFGAFDCGPIDGEDFVNNAEECIECGLNRIAAPDCRE